ncbi:MAG: hypothetical protein IPJ48_16250 [Propionivibrio sp.]|uniref:Uncharacterized protein n=1 Tax=Candidatus Propionivibrio dominans TaxID=2954373 RepID=A0A9D7FHT2_9RHOO|nr:hypothetical protein [Candidatus Propionivibrio dominans]
MRPNPAKHGVAANKSRSLRFLGFMEKLGILDTAERWKVIRELRNAVNHDYEENEQRLSEFFLALTQAAPELYTIDKWTRMPKSESPATAAYSFRQRTQASGERSLCA